MTHEDAEKKICPFMRAQEGWINCLSDRCMVWVDWGERSGDGKKTGHCGVACPDEMK